MDTRKFAMNNLIKHSKPWISDEDRYAVFDSLKNDVLVDGINTENIKNQFRKKFDVEACVITDSGTHAIQLGLEMLNIKKGDFVIAPNYVCYEVLEAIKSIGAEPQLCDTNELGVIDQSSVAARLNSKVKAIIAVHIFGIPCDINELKNFGIPIIEDSCHAFGLEIDGKQSGTLGDIGIFSFHPTKCFTMGGHGLLILNNPEILQDLDTESSVEFEKKNLSEMHAALGLSQLARYDRFIERRQEIREFYDSTLAELSNLDFVKSTSNFLFRYTFQSHLPFEKIKFHYAEDNIMVTRGVDKLLHQYGSNNNAIFPKSKILFDRNLSIPFYPALTDQEIERVMDSTRRLFHGN